MVVATFLHRETDEHLAEFWVVIVCLLNMYNQQTIFIECHFMVVAIFLHRETDEHLAE
jgi:hypothetical protein